LSGQANLIDLLVCTLFGSEAATQITLHGLKQHMLHHLSLASALNHWGGDSDSEPQNAPMVLQTLFLGCQGSVDQ